MQSEAVIFCEGSRESHKSCMHHMAMHGYDTTREYIRNGSSSSFPENVHTQPKCSQALNQQLPSRKCSQNPKMFTIFETAAPSRKCSQTAKMFTSMKTVAPLENVHKLPKCSQALNQQLLSRKCSQTAKMFTSMKTVAPFQKTFTNSQNVHNL